MISPSLPPPARAFWTLFSRDPVMKQLYAWLGDALGQHLLKHCSRPGDQEAGLRPQPPSSRQDRALLLKADGLVGIRETTGPKEMPSRPRGQTRGSEVTAMICSTPCVRSCAAQGPVCLHQSCSLRQPALQTPGPQDLDSNIHTLHPSFLYKRERKHG